MSWSNSQKSCAEFMRKAGQVVRDRPEVPRTDERLRCLKLVAEEAFFEFADALGLTVFGPDGTKLSLGQLKLETTHEPNLVEIADAIADGHYVLTCAAAACGIDEQQIIDEVNASNLAKFGPGHTIREDGKLIKPPGFLPPDIGAILEEQGKPLRQQIVSKAGELFHFDGHHYPLVLLWDYYKRDGFDTLHEYFPWVTMEHVEAIEWWLGWYMNAKWEFQAYFGRAMPTYS